MPCFNFNESVRISETSLKTAISELDDLHRKAHKLVEGEVDDLVSQEERAKNCPYCSLGIAVGDDPAIAMVLANKITSLVAACLSAKNLKFIALSPDTNDFITLHNLIFIHGYAIGMKCGRNDAIAEFTGVK